MRGVVAAAVLLGMLAACGDNPPPDEDADAEAPECEYVAASFEDLLVSKLNERSQGLRYVQAFRSGDVWYVSAHSFTTPYRGRFADRVTWATTSIVSADATVVAVNAKAQSVSTWPGAAQGITASEDDPAAARSAECVEDATMEY